ncbi:hypothetical protein [Cohnella nanjingensis]|uniref:Lipoprotein n=1 Tax=Cohnella nanjingensis TaxID=1387779 RepID=A0A7X0RP72_9BACL|nr:hypothetical protein [Cohnella nanjingensis]MBB6671132.1 hypothetical protein [Cohnella nanjingensis]
MKRLTTARARSGLARAGAVSVAGLALLLLLPGCARQTPDKPPEEAFALTASALSGDDRFAYQGESSAYDGAGRLRRRMSFGGEVANHRIVALSGEAHGTGEAGASASPLALVKAVERHAASVAYAPEQRKGEVTLKLVLAPAAAQRRMADDLQGQLPPEALRTLSASTVCWWTADRRTWFPLRLREESAIRYRLSGKSHEERRTVVTSFQRSPDSGTIEK